MKLRMMVLFLLLPTTVCLADTAQVKPSLISGWASLGADVTFWSLDDSFSSNLIEMKTKRDTPVFYTFDVTINDLLGWRASANLFLDKLLNPLGLLSPDLSLGLSGTSGGITTDFSLPLDDVLDAPMTLDYHYKYRVFRWENTIVSKFLGGRVDYYDEKGVRSLYDIGSTFSTGSALKDTIVGVTSKFDDDFPMSFFVGAEYWEFLAPTLLDLSIRDSLSTFAANMIMQTYNRLLGLRVSLDVGENPQNFSGVGEFPSLGVTLGMTLGNYWASNDYFEGPPSLASTMFSGIHSGFRVSAGKNTEFVILFGVDGTFSLLNTFGSASDPGKALKKVTYDAIGSEFSIASGQALDVSVDRWEVFVVPYVKADLKF